MKSTIANEKSKVRTSRKEVMDFAQALWVAGIKWDRVINEGKAVIGVFYDNGRRKKEELEKITGFSLKTSKKNNRLYFYI